ncbi:uncharacterized protein C7orf50 homolog [Orussus abietinus]|uniref:uncharacterized protein C7orf50 homolog n=1 Tax=Orussus abietinus TaxID=222816 RepID=UPI0006268325|nr:uncharacterized protein C7orf50 homolog [Orussus abietinus]
MASTDSKNVEVRKTKSKRHKKKKIKSEGKEDNVNYYVDKTGNKNNLDAPTDSVNDQVSSTRQRKSQRTIVGNSSLNGTGRNQIENKEQEKKKQKGKRKVKQENDEVTDESPTKKIKKTSTDSEDTDEEDCDIAEEDNAQKPPKMSKRQIKKEKTEKKEAEKKEASKLEAKQRALNYVSKWKHAKSEWRFEKLRQIWLMDHLLDQTSIPDSIFPTVLEYFEGCKGMAREQLSKKGMDVIKKVEEDEEKREEIMESIEYKRARQLLQALPSET